VILSAAYINLDWLVLGGAFLPPAFGLWVLALKPQASGGLVLLWLWRAWRGRAALSKLERVNLGLFVVCCAAWVLLVPHKDPLVNASTALFPFAVLPGIWLLLRAFRRDDERLALAVAPLLSPYVGFGSWVVMLPMLRGHKWSLAAFVFAGWIVAFAGRWF